MFNLYYLYASTVEYREELIDNCRLAQKSLCDGTDLDHEIDELYREIEVVAELSKKAIYENAHVALNQDEWHERNNGYLERHQKALERVNKLEDLKRERQSKSLKLDGFIQNLSACDSTIEEFDDRLWMNAINEVVVLAKGELKFRFKDGTEITN